MTNTLSKKLEKLYGLRLYAGRTHNDIRTDYLTLLKRLDDPHLKIPPAIHVAGTNGKGSTIAFLKAMYEAQGYRVHVYTSPHLIRFNERIVLAGSEIDDGSLEALLDEVTSQTRDLEITFFEVATALAFLSFSRTPADISLVEVGMGGRMDCTNVIEKPLASIITRISLDHCQYLGNTIQEIAREKAGIMKPGVPCIIGYQQAHQGDDSETLPFDSLAGQNDTPLHRAGHEWSSSTIDSDPSQFIFRYGSLQYSYPVPSLVGAHQLENAGAALACTHLIDSFPIHEESRVAGLRRVSWPGRLQRLQGHPLNDLTPADCDLWLDGGHNDSAGQILAQQALAWHNTDARPLHMVMAMKRDKDAILFLTPLLPHLRSLTIIPLPGFGDQSHDPTLLSQTIQEKAPTLTVKTAPDMTRSLQGIPLNETPARILLTGSLFLVGDILKQGSDNG